MMKNTNFYLIIIGLFFAACETDFDVNAEWKESTVVYGLLDQSLDTQRVVIYKAFLGEESAYVIAEEADSIYYQADDLEVFLYEVAGDDTVNAIELEYFITDNRSNSSENIFSTEYSVEYITTDSLNRDYTYHLYVHNLKTGNEVTSSTTLISEMDFSSTSSSDLNLYKNDEFKSFILKWKKSSNASIYKPILRFYYYEKNVSTGDVSLNYIDKSFSDLTPEDFSGSNSMQIQIEGQSFYYFVKNSIEESNQVIRINAKELEDGFSSPEYWIGGVDFIFVLGGSEISQYIEINNLPGLLFQEPPTYTNIINGVGVFSSRLNDSYVGKVLSDDALLFLSEGELTSELNFLAP